MTGPAAVPGATPGSGPLAGLLVADFSRVLAGPYATMLLADLGAEVVKVEGPAGDDTRSWQPPVRDGVSTYYLGVNRNKRSVALDLKDPADRAVAQELARRADVVIENFRSGGLARFGRQRRQRVALGDRQVAEAEEEAVAEPLAHPPQDRLGAEAEGALEVAEHHQLQRPPALASQVVAVLERR